MNIAILTNNEPSFPITLARGLSRMLAGLNVPHKVILDGLAMLNAVPENASTVKRPGLLDRFARLGRPPARSYQDFLESMRDFDVVIVVGFLPDAFLSDRYRGIEEIRRRYPHTRIVLYANYYLGTRGPWVRWLKDGNVAKGVRCSGNYGLERYDWHLAVTATSHFRISADSRHPLSIIGVNVEEPELTPDAFDGANRVAILDFEQRGENDERLVQIAALRATDTPFESLSGQYSRSEIRGVYRRCKAYFVATHESFGLPIIETQACGSYIFTPRSRWVASHCVKELYVPGDGALTSNFIVYDSDQRKLEAALMRVFADYDPQSVVQTLKAAQPQFYWGDSEALLHFVGMCHAGTIHSQLHRQHLALNATIQTESE